MTFSNDMLVAFARTVSRHGTITNDKAQAFAGSCLRAWEGRVTSAATAFSIGRDIINEAARAGYITRTRGGVRGKARFKSGVNKAPVAPGDKRPAVSGRDSEVLADADVLNTALWQQGDIPFTTHKPTAQVLRSLKADGVWSPSKEENRSVDWHCRSNGSWHLSPFADWRGRIYLQDGEHGSPMTDHVNRGCTDLADATVASLEDQAYIMAIIADEYDLNLQLAKDYLNDPVQWCRDHGVPHSVGNFTRAAFCLVEMAAGQATGYIVQQDASCSGFQIMALLTGDADLAMQVNLLSPEKSYDLYSHVAEEAGIFAMLSEMGIEARFARLVAKAVVMLVGYGAGVATVANGILAKGDCQEQDEDGNVIASTFGGVRVSVLDATQLAEAGVGTLYQLFPTLELMKQEAQRWAKEQGTEWTSPSGMLCRKHDVCIDEETGEVYADAGAAGALPNLVHSIDGAIAAKVIATFGAACVTIHDSFGCGVAHVSRMRRCVAEAYVWAIEEFDTPFALPSSTGFPLCWILDSALVA